MSAFKYRHFQREIILQCVRWYCKYGISYRDLEEMMEERRVRVDHTTIYRWVQRYAPELEKQMRWYKKFSFSGSWRVDETYIKVKGVWKYLYRAVDKYGRTIDFYLSHTRNTKAAKRFLQKAIKGLKEWEQPYVINTDQNSTYGKAIKMLKEEHRLSASTEHRKAKYLNNIVEADHGKLKRLIKPTLGFKSMKTAYATIKGFETMRMFKKGQFDLFMYGAKSKLMGEIRLIDRQFDYF
ncbi:MAG: IS6 family transposase [Bacteroidia bacterium]|nr:IS6 family transposase [Bacteroidia bacterium]